ncbi:MAG TPA: GIY-YIG nuclease family protein [bacterium]|nr:GIY-YIG nuclease family protein [bacterium]HMW35410.1 GIY-YIG nuclease family protein [bacterium]HMY35088.1 GIY-YIG nuclease family protein [bacterium]HNB10025.1 GIY-YIG nuclease family protein [bacterium]HNC48412.1 GIY-YIG nuclease family protein [bacterium]
MKFSVYILYSKSCRRYYVGQTQDLERRLEEHNHGLSPSTRNGAPWVIVYQFACDTRSDAMRIEKQIKKQGAARYIERQALGVTPKA